VCLSVSRITDYVIRRFQWNSALWLSLPVGRLWLTFGGNPFPDTDSGLLFHLPRHCRIRHFKRIISIISRTVNSHFSRNLAKSLMPTRRWICYVLGIVYQISGSWTIRKFCFKSQITFVWRFGKMIGVGSGGYAVSECILLLDALILTACTCSVCWALCCHLLFYRSFGNALGNCLGNMNYLRCISRAPKPVSTHLCMAIYVSVMNLDLV